MADTGAGENVKAKPQVRIVATGREADDLRRVELGRLWGESARHAADAGMTEADVTREIERDRDGR